MRHVLKGSVVTLLLALCFLPAAYATRTVSNPSLEADANGDSVPDCWMKLGYGTNSFRFVRTTDAHSGTYAERVKITSLTSGDRKLVIKQDSGACALQVTPGRSYRLTAWYKSDVPTEFVLFTRTSAGNWGYWKSSPIFPASAGWSRATWTTPPIPDDVTHLSFGLNLMEAGALTVDDLSASQVTPDPAPETPGSDPGPAPTPEPAPAPEPTPTAEPAPTPTEEPEQAPEPPPTPEPAPTPTPEPARTPFGARGYCETRPVGSPPLSDAEAAARALLHPIEATPGNETYNRRVPTPEEISAFRSEADKAGWGDEPYNPYVTGNFVGTTDEIFSWAACKWGIDEDTIRAVAVQESEWRQTMLGDWHSCLSDYQSRGIMQVKAKYPACPHGWYGTVSLNEQSTPFNVDYYASRLRWCYDGKINWRGDYPPGDLWGCVGWWYSGGWHDAGAEDYNAKVKAHLANRAWSTTRTDLASGLPDMAAGLGAP